LVNTEQEIVNIVDVFNHKGLTGIGFLHDNATKANFKKEIGHYRYVHIATHGISNDEYPALSGLVFAPSAVDSTSTDPDKNQGMLFTGEIYDLNLNANLVVLSACESGTGKLIRGEGLMSLTRGFVYAGVPQIIYSLWKVGDRSTCELMTEFYNGLLQNKPTERALRDAKIKLLDNPDTSSPRCWAAFALLGK
jgi:CHAT domain-containing protein